MPLPALWRGAARAGPGSGQGRAAAAGAAGFAQGWRLPRSARARVGACPLVPGCRAVPLQAAEDFSSSLCAALDVPRPFLVLSLHDLEWFVNNNSCIFNILFMLTVVSLWRVCCRLLERHFPACVYFMQAMNTTSKNIMETNSFILLLPEALLSLGHMYKYNFLSWRCVGGWELMGEHEAFATYLRRIPSQSQRQRSTTDFELISAVSEPQWTYACSRAAVFAVGQSFLLCPLTDQNLHSGYCSLSTLGACPWKLEDWAQT